jgi:hypothetical protein
MAARRKVGVVSAVLLAAVLASHVTPASAAACRMRLSIELTPDVPDPLDAGFLSSLLNNQVSYRLTLLGRQPGSVIVTELAGPGPDYRCRNVVETMRKDGRVLSIHLDRDNAMRAASDRMPRGTLDLRPPDLQSLDAGRQTIGIPSNSDEAEAVTIAAAPLRVEEQPNAQPPPDGLASLYWASRHLAQAWRIFLPLRISADDLTPGSSEPTAAYAPEVLVEQRDISANPAPITLGPNTGG